MESFCQRLSSMETRIISRFSEESLLKFYKGTHSRDKEFESDETTLNKHLSKALILV